jgi:hypothetical protein
VVPPAQINEDFLLLPFRQQPPFINYTLSATRGCFQWASSRPDRVRVAAVSSLRGGESRCAPGYSQHAVVTAISDRPDRVDSVVDAISDDGRVSLRTQVAVAPIESIELSTVAESIGVGSSERVTLVGKDRGGVNTFSTLEGMEFVWSVRAILPDDSVSEDVDSHAILDLRTLMSSSVRVSPTRQVIESRGGMTDQVVLHGSGPGRVLVHARLQEAGYPSQPTTVKRMKVLEQLALVPSVGVSIPVGADVGFGLFRSNSSGHRHEVELPDVHFSFKTSDTSVSRVESLRLFVTGVAPGGVSDVQVLDDRLPGDVVRDASVHVFEPHRVDFAVEPYLGGAVEIEREWFFPSMRVGVPTLTQSHQFPAWMQLGWGRRTVQLASRVQSVRMMRHRLFSLHPSVHPAGEQSSRLQREEPGINTLFEIELVQSSSGEAVQGSCGVPARILPLELTALLEAATSPAMASAVNLAPLPASPCDLPTTSKGVQDLASRIGVPLDRLNGHAFLPPRAAVLNSTHARAQTVLVASCPCDGESAEFSVRVSLGEIRSLLVDEAQWTAATPLVVEEPIRITSPIRISFPDVRPIALPFVNAPDPEAACHVIDLATDGGSGHAVTHEADAQAFQIAGSLFLARAGWTGEAPASPKSIVIFFEGTRVCSGFTPGQTVVVVSDLTDALNADAVAIHVSSPRTINPLPSWIVETRVKNEVWVGFSASGDLDTPFFSCSLLDKATTWSLPQSASGVALAAPTGSESAHWQLEGRSKRAVCSWRKVTMAHAGTTKVLIRLMAATQSAEEATSLPLEESLVVVSHPPLQVRFPPLWAARAGTAAPGFPGDEVSASSTASASPVWSSLGLRVGGKGVPVSSTTAVDTATRVVLSSGGHASSKLSTILLQGGPGLLPGVSKPWPAVSILPLGESVSDAGRLRLRPLREPQGASPAIAFPGALPAEHLSRTHPLDALLAGVIQPGSFAPSDATVPTGPWTVLEASCEHVPATETVETTFLVSVQAAPQSAENHTGAVETAAVTVSCQGLPASPALVLARGRANRSELAISSPEDSAEARSGVQHVLAGVVYSVFRDLHSRSVTGERSLRLSGVQRDPSNVVLTSVSGFEDSAQLLASLVAPSSHFSFVLESNRTGTVRHDAPAPQGYIRAVDSGSLSEPGSPEDDMSDQGSHPTTAAILSAIPKRHAAMLLTATELPVPRSQDLFLMDVSSIAEGPSPRLRRVPSAIAPRAASLSPAAQGPNSVVFTPVTNPAAAEAAHRFLSRGAIFSRIAAGSAPALLALPPWAAGRSLTLTSGDTSIRVKVVPGAMLHPPDVLVPLQEQVQVSLTCRGGSPDVTIAPTKLEPTMFAFNATEHLATFRPLKAGASVIRCEDKGVDAGILGRRAADYVTQSTITVAAAASVSLEGWSILPLGRPRPLYLHVATASGRRFAPSFHAAFQPMVTSSDPSTVASLRLKDSPLPPGDPASLVEAVEALAGGSVPPSSSPSFALRGMACGMATLSAAVSVCPPGSACHVIRSSPLRVQVIPALEVRPRAVSLLPNSSLVLHVSGQLQNSEVAGAQLLFHSSDPTVVSVGADGAVRALKPGLATILVRSVHPRAFAPRLAIGTAPAILEDGSVSWRDAAASTTLLPFHAQPGGFNRTVPILDDVTKTAYPQAVMDKWQRAASRPAMARAPLVPWGVGLTPPASDLWREWEVIDSAVVRVRVLQEVEWVLSAPSSELVVGESIKAVLRTAEGASPLSFATAGVHTHWAVAGTAINAPNFASGDDSGALVTPEGRTRVEARGGQVGGGFAREVRAMKEGTGVLTVTVTYPSAQGEMLQVTTSRSFRVSPRLALVQPPPPVSVAALDTGSDEARKVWPQIASPHLLLPPCASVTLKTTLDGLTQLTYSVLEALPSDSTNNVAARAVAHIDHVRGVVTVSASAGMSTVVITDLRSGQALSVVIEVAEVMSLSLHGPAFTPIGGSTVLSIQGKDGHGRRFLEHGSGVNWGMGRGSSSCATLKELRAINASSTVGDGGQDCPDLGGVSVVSLNPSVATASIRQDGRVQVRSRTPGSTMLRVWLPAAAHSAAWRTMLWSASRRDVRDAGAQSSSRSVLATNKFQAVHSPAEVLPFHSFEHEEDMAGSLQAGGVDEWVRAWSMPDTGASDPASVAAMMHAAQSDSAAALLPLSPRPLMQLEESSFSLSTPLWHFRSLGDWFTVTVSTLLRPPGPVRVLQGGSVQFRLERGAAFGLVDAVIGTTDEGDVVVKEESPLQSGVWSTSNSQVVQVTQQGVVQATQLGSAAVSFQFTQEEHQATAGSSVSIHVVSLRSARLEWVDSSAANQWNVTGGHPPSVYTDLMQVPPSEPTTTVAGRTVPARCAGRASGDCLHPWRELRIARLDIDPVDEYGLEIPVDADGAIDHGLSVECRVMSPFADQFVSAVAVGPGAVESVNIPPHVRAAVEARLAHRIVQPECLLIPAPPPALPEHSSILLQRPQGTPPAEFSVQVSLRARSSEAAVNASLHSIKFRTTPQLSRSEEEPPLAAESPSSSLFIRGCPVGSIVLTNSRPSYSLFAFGDVSSQDIGSSDPDRLQVTSEDKHSSGGSYRPVAAVVKVSVTKQWLQAAAASSQSHQPGTVGGPFVSAGVRVVDPSTGASTVAPVCFVPTLGTAVDGTPNQVAFLDMVAGWIDGGVATMTSGASVAVVFAAFTLVAVVLSRLATS